ncbi:MAG: leucine-rich repeat domain-containing protein [Clostridia bacterium]|nr:leucine-rich repeat domain-containing protein [Clostridia bacterium]
MKKLLTVFLVLIIACTCSACLVTMNIAGSGGSNNGGNDNGGNNDGGQPSNEPVYATEYSYDETHHWYPLISGEGEEKMEYAEHDNDKGKCYYCNYYFDCTHMLDFERCTLGGVKGYMITGFKDEDYFGQTYVHYEIPKFYQGEGDNEPLPIISIGYGAFANGIVNGQIYNETPIESIKLHDNLLEIRDWAFLNSEITELIIPDSVTNEYLTYRGASSIYNICGGCYKLKKFVLGNGIRNLLSYNFGSSVEEVILGSSLKKIAPRAFYEIYDLKYLVIPASVNYIPEGSVTPTSGNYEGISIPLVNMLPARAETVIYMEITKEEHDALVVPLRQRDPVTGAILDPIDYGFVNGWSGNCKVYFKGEWQYNANGKPEVIK